MDGNPAKRKYGVGNDGLRWESTPIRKRKDKNEEPFSSPVSPDQQPGNFSPRLMRSPLVSFNTSLRLRKRRVIQQSSPGTPIQQSSLTSPKSAITPFISGREFLNLVENSNSVSTSKRTVLYNSLTRNDLSELNDSDLNDFDPDKCLNEAKPNEIAQNWMSDDSDLGNFDLEEAIGEVNTSTNSKFNNSFPEEFHLEDFDINEVERSKFIREKLQNCSRKQDSISKSILYSDDHANSWETSVSNVNTSKLDASCLNEQDILETGSASDVSLVSRMYLSQEHKALNKSPSLNPNDTNSPRPSVSDISKNKSSHNEEAKSKTASAMEASMNLGWNYDQEHKTLLDILSQDDANSWGISPTVSTSKETATPGPNSSRKSRSDSGLGTSFNSRDSSGCNGSAKKSTPRPNDATPKGLTRELRFSKGLKDQLRANNGKSNPAPRERCNAFGKEEETFFGLPYAVKLLISKYKGITDLYPWQKKCLNLEAISKRKNLIYALPTSGGKTLVAEILMLKEILCREKNVIFILPYVSIVQEKVRSLSPFGVDLKFLVEEYAGGKGAFPPVKRSRKRTIYVATIEKASGLVNSLIETDRLADEIGLICIDELHLIGEPRGAILESTLTKIMFSHVSIHVIGMSATIGNISQLAEFLNAETFTGDFRPVELKEYVKCGNTIFSIESNIEGKQLKSSRDVKLQPNDPDYVAGLVGEVIPHDSCLVFCASKKNCENIAKLICNALDESLKHHRNNERSAFLRALAVEGNGSVCPILSQTIPFGVAYHHSGLTVGERKLLEEAFYTGTISCICCTSTLAAGVNLPAKRVIIRSPYVGNKFITFSQYKQMIGRAGRAGFGTEGESYLLCQQTDSAKVNTLINSKVNSCDSQLEEEKSLPSLILSAIGLKLAVTQEELTKFLNCSLFYAQKAFDSNGIDSLVEDAINKLLKVGALETKMKENLRVYELSRIGKAAVKGNISIDDAKKLYVNLKIALQCVSLSNYLHRLYLITPYSMAEQIPINRDSYFNVYLSLTDEELYVARIIGIDDGSMMQFMSGKKSMGDKMAKMHLFYLTLILHSLWEGRNVWQVASLFNISRGLVHSFLTSAATFNSSVIRFCEELSEFSCVAVLLKEMSEKLIHCCSAELLPLMELPSVKLGRAKQLMNAGFKNLQIIATSDVNNMVSKIDHLPKRVACQIIAAAKLLLLSKAELLQEEAELVLKGLEGMNIQ